MCSHTLRYGLAGTSPGSLVHSHMCQPWGHTHSHPGVIMSWEPRQCHLKSNAYLPLPPCETPGSTLRGSSQCQEPTRARGSSWRGGWVQCSVVNTWWPCPRSGIPRRWMRDSIMPTVDCASPSALRFLGRVAPVCKSSRVGSGPDLSSQWPWGRECLWTHIPTGLWSVALLWVTPHGPLLLSGHAMRLPRLLLSFSHPHVI